MFAAPAVVDGNTLAWIIARSSSPPGEVELAAVEYGAVLVALELLRERTAIEVETRLRGGLMEELFSDGVVREVVAKRALAFGYDLGHPFAGVPGRGHLRRRWRRGAAARLRVPVRRRRRLARSPGAAAAWSRSGPGRSWSLHPSYPTRPRRRDERRFEDELRAATAAMLPDAALNMAVGTACEEVADYRDSYLAARRGLDLLRLLGRSGEVFSFRGSSLNSMLLQSTRPDVVVKFISRYVEPLDRYDSTHTSELRRTLEVYYESGQPRGCRAGPCTCTSRRCATGSEGPPTCSAWT